MIIIGKRFAALALGFAVTGLALPSFAQTSDDEQGTARRVCGRLL